MSKNSKFLAINGGDPVSKSLIPIHKPYLGEDDFNAVNEAVRTTFISGDGPLCRIFEQKLAEYLGVKHVFFTVSCTAALDLAFLVKGFPKDREVLVPDFTYTSTALAPLLNNLKVVLVDVDKTNGNIDVQKIEGKITEKTVAICPVDYAGNPADMDCINAIAEKYGLYVVHDTAQSIGSFYKGKKTGTLAHVSCFSFHGTKNITTGEGGALVTNDDEIAERVKYARDKGTDKYSFISNPEKRGFYEYVSLGNSYVQSNILGALGISQLKKLNIINERRKEIANLYIDNFSLLNNIQLPEIVKDYERNWHIFYLLVPKGHKYWIIEALREEGIIANIHYNPLHMNKFYKQLGSDKDFPGSISLFNSLVRIPLYPSLTETEVELIITAINKVIGSVIE